MFKGNIASPNEGLFYVSEAYRMTSEIACKSWQRLWDREYTEGYT